MNESNTKGDGENSKRDSEIIIAGKKDLQQRNGHTGNQDPLHHDRSDLASLSLIRSISK